MVNEYSKTSPETEIKLVHLKCENEKVAYRTSTHNLLHTFGPLDIQPALRVSDAEATFP